MSYENRLGVEESEPDAGRVCVEVVAIEEIDGEMDVYDITVEEDHSFIVCGVVVHNCPQCAALDGKVFPVDKGPRPPIHPACRCVMTAVLKDASDLGLPPSTRASMNGQLPDTVTYGDWLARQSENIQEEFLGVKRTQLFRDGKLSFDRFINEQGFFYTLPQLKQRESAAWSRAGL